MNPTLRKAIDDYTILERMKGEDHHEVLAMRTQLMRLAKGDVVGFSEAKARMRPDLLSPEEIETRHQTKFTQQMLENENAKRAMKTENENIGRAVKTHDKLSGNFKKYARDAYDEGDTDLAKEHRDTAEAHHQISDHLWNALNAREGSPERRAHLDRGLALMGTRIGKDDPTS